MPKLGFNFYEMDPWISKKYCPLLGFGVPFSCFECICGSLKRPFGKTQKIAPPLVKLLLTPMLSPLQIAKLYKQTHMREEDLSSRPFNVSFAFVPRALQILFFRIFKGTLYLYFCLYLSLHVYVIFPTFLWSVAI